MKEQDLTSGISEEELRDILERLDALKEKDSQSDEITTDDELHQWIKDKVGIDIPRVAVCEEHDAPFSFIADLFFKRVDAALVVGSRGSGKSYLAALWNFLNCYHDPGAECLTVGAQDIQSRRVYSHIKQFQTKAASDKIGNSTITETLWKNGSKYEILTGSLGSVNGPHNQKVHRDEIELMDPQVYQESLQIERAKIVDGKEINSQTLLTSTRKTSHGLMQKLIDECAEAEKEGRKPPYKVYWMCIKECVQNQPGCRVAYPNLPDNEKCDCHLIQKDEWEEGVPRTLDTVCDGAFAKAEGFIPLDDLQKTFMKSSKAMWDAQQECKRPYSEDISLEQFSREKHGIRDFKLDPDNGPIFMGLDVGGTSPHAVEWGQYLIYEAEAKNYKGDPKRIPQGSIVLFDELYIAELGNDELIDLIVETESLYRQNHPNFRVRGRFIDPQAKLTRLDFRNHKPSLKSSWPVQTRDREEHFKRLRERVTNNTFYVSLDNNPMFVEEVEAWNITIKKNDHAVDSCMYLVSNANQLINDGLHDINELPAHKLGSGPKKPYQFEDKMPATRPKPSRSALSVGADESWRGSFF